MAKKKIIIASIITAALIVIYFPSFSKLQQLRREKKGLEEKIEELKEENKELGEEIYKLETDPTYLENVARNKLKKTRKGEIIYKLD